MDKNRIENILNNKQIWMIGKTDEMYRTFLSHLHNRDLSHLSLTDTDLEGADLQGCNLTATSFHGANLRGVNFTGCHLLGTDFRGADLTGAIFSEAVMTSCDLRSANCKDIVTDGAVIKGVDLREASGDIVKLANTVPFVMPENFYEEVWPEAVQQNVEETRIAVEQERRALEESEKNAMQRLAEEYEEKEKEAAKIAEEKAKSVPVTEESFEQYLINNAFALAKKYRTGEDSDPLDELAADLEGSAGNTVISDAESPAELARRGETPAAKRRKLK